MARSVPDGTVSSTTHGSPTHRAERAAARPPTVGTCPGHAGVGSVRWPSPPRPTEAPARWPRTSRARSASPTSSASGRTSGSACSSRSPRPSWSRPASPFVATVVAIAAGTALGCVLLGAGRPGRRRDRRADDGAAARPARPPRVVRCRPRSTCCSASAGPRTRSGSSPSPRTRSGTGCPAGRTCCSPAAWRPRWRCARSARSGCSSGSPWSRCWPARRTSCSRPPRRPLGDLTAGGWTGFWTSMDLVIALPVSWIPLVADYSRFSRSGRAAALGTGDRVRAVLGRLLPARRAGAARVRDRAGQRRGRRAARGAGRRGRAGHPGRLRGGRGVRQHLLDRDQRAERAAPRWTGGCWRWASARSRPCSRWPSTAARTSPSSS